MVNNLVFRWPTPLSFMEKWGAHGSLNNDLLQLSSKTVAAKTPILHRSNLLWTHAEDSPAAGYVHQKRTIQEKGASFPSPGINRHILSWWLGCQITSSAEYLGSIIILRRWARIPRVSGKFNYKSLGLNVSAILGSDSLTTKPPPFRVTDWLSSNERNLIATVGGRNPKQPPGMVKTL